MCNVRTITSGVMVRLRARKCDKVLRRDPWHFLECSCLRGQSTLELEFCIPCALVSVMWGRIDQGASDLDPVFADGEGLALPAPVVGFVLNATCAAAGVEAPAAFTGKSARVGGAVFAALGGASELAIRVTGDWQSDTIRRYIGGMMAAKNGVVRRMFISSVSSSPFPSPSPPQC